MTLLDPYEGGAATRGMRAPPVWPSFKKPIKTSKLPSTPLIRSGNSWWEGTPRVAQLDGPVDCVDLHAWRRYLALVETYRFRGESSIYSYTV